MNLQFFNKLLGFALLNILIIGQVYAETEKNNKENVPQEQNFDDDNDILIDDEVMEDD